MKRQEESVPLIKVAPQSAATHPSGDSTTETAARTVLITEEERRLDAGSSSLSEQYTILEKIGEGGMGVVYLARDRKLGRYAAIKRLNRSAMAHASLKERFMREALAIAALNHIHIVHIYALGEDSDGPYIVMEYLAGPQEASPNKTPPAPFSLADRVNRNGPMTVNDAVDLVMKVCKAVDFAHACGIIHRDLKPSNVLLDETGEPKIVDFGLARVTDQSADPLTVPGERMLSLGYGAPEQEQDASLVDKRADIYGLGAILYFSITGKNPRYFRENDVPEPLRMPILKALETDREKRWPTVRDFTSALNMIKEPSKIELPTVKTTWRCRWCDTVNPIAIQYCGKCGWDGGERCAECDAETRVGIQFCGNCGADAREYEQAILLLKRLRQFREQKQFELIPPHAERISSFRPVGLGGQKLVEQIRTLSREAQDAIGRRDKLKLSIQSELAARSYERAREYIAEYNTLAVDNAFADALKDLPDLTLTRDLDRARKAIDDREWDYARRTCQWVLDSISKDNAEAKGLLDIIDSHRSQMRRRLAGVAVIGLFFLYLFSAAPVFRLAGSPAPDSSFYRFYDPVVLVHDGTFMKWPLDTYASLLGATNMFNVYALTNAVAYRPATTNRVAILRPTHTATNTTDKLESYRVDYETALAKIEKENDSRMRLWPAEYRGALTNLNQKLQQAGDFEGCVSVQAEIDRFDTDPKLPDEFPDTTPKELRNLQDRFKGQLVNYANDRNSRIVQLTMEDYVKKKLDPLRSEFTKNGKMMDAKRVDAEIKRVKTSPEVVAAEDEIAKRQAARPPK